MLNLLDNPWLEPYSLVIIFVLLNNRKRFITIQLDVYEIQTVYVLKHDWPNCLHTMKKLGYCWVYFTRLTQNLLLITWRFINFYWLKWIYLYYSRKDVLNCRLLLIQALLLTFFANFFSHICSQLISKKL